MGALVSHDLTIEDLGMAMWALDIAPRFGLVFHWSDGVKVRGWSVLTPRERAPFEACKPAIRAMITPDASGRAALDYIRDLGPPPDEATIKPALADKLAKKAADHRGDVNERGTAWRMLYAGGALRPIEPRLPPPEPPKAEPQRPAWGTGWQSRQPQPPPRRESKWEPPPRPSKPPPRGCEDWSEGWQFFRNTANWFGDKGHRRTTIFGFRVSVHAEPPKDKWSPPRWSWFAEAPDGKTMSGKSLRHEATALGNAWRWMRSVWP
jgi:hypothetical protein